MSDQSTESGRRTCDAMLDECPLAECVTDLPAAEEMNLVRQSVRVPQASVHAEARRRAVTALLDHTPDGRRSSGCRRQRHVLPVPPYSAGHYRSIPHWMTYCIQYWRVKKGWSATADFDVNNIHDDRHGALWVGYRPDSCKNTP